MKDLDRIRDLPITPSASIDAQTRLVVQNKGNAQAGQVAAFELIGRWLESVGVDLTGFVNTDSLPEGTANLYFTTARASAAAPVQSVHGRTGTVVAAASDYDASEIDNDSGVSGATVADALDALAAGGYGYWQVDQLYVIYLNNITGGPFAVGETVTGGTSGDTATVVYESDNYGLTTRYLIVTEPDGPFHTTNESITGATSGASASSQGAPLNTYGPRAQMTAATSAVIQGGPGSTDELWLVANPDEDSDVGIILGSRRLAGYFDVADAATGTDGPSFMVGSLVTDPGTSTYPTPFQGCSRVVGDAYYCALRGLVTKENAIVGSEIIAIELMMPNSAGGNEVNNRFAGVIGAQWLDATASAEDSQIIFRPTADGDSLTAIAVRLDSSTAPYGPQLCWLQPPNPPSTSNSYYEGVTATFVPNNGSGSSRDGYLTWDVVDNSGANAQSEVLRFGYDSTASAGEEGFLTLNGVLDVDYAKTILPSTSGSPTLGSALGGWWDALYAKDVFVLDNTGLYGLFSSGGSKRAEFALDESGTTAYMRTEASSGFDLDISADGTLTLQSPTLVTPALGTPASGVLTNCTGQYVVGGSYTPAITVNTTEKFAPFMGALNGGNTFSTVLYQAAPFTGVLEWFSFWIQATPAGTITVRFRNVTTASQISFTTTSTGVTTYSAATLSVTQGDVVWIGVVDTASTGLTNCSWTWRGRTT